MEEVCTGRIFHYLVRSYPCVAFSRTTELNLSLAPRRRRRKRRVMKGRKRGMREEAPLRVEGARKEEFSIPLLLDHPTAVHRVSEWNRQAGWTFFTCGSWNEMHINNFVFRVSGEETSAAVGQEQVWVRERDRSHPKKENQKRTGTSLLLTSRQEQRTARVVKCAWKMLQFYSPLYLFIYSLCVIS